MHDARRRRSRTPWPPDAVSPGFTLAEVLVALFITVIAVTGLAHTFGVGRGLIDRYATGRDALATAQRRMEMLRMLSMREQAVINPEPDLTIGVHGTFPVQLNATINGSEQWTVTWVDDPSDGLGGADTDGGNDYKRATVDISWAQSGATDKVELSADFLKP